MDGRKLWEDPLQHPVCVGLMVHKKLRKQKTIEIEGPTI